MSRNKSFCLLTDRVWDFQALRTLYQKYSCSPRLNHWNRVFNLRVEFTRKYGSIIRPENSRNILEILKIQFPSPFLTALDECLAQASITLRMARDGYTFLNPDILSDKHKPLQTTFELSNSVLRLSGLTWDIRTQDIIDFFSGIILKPEDILIILNRSGLPTGWALVHFSHHSQDALVAFSRHLGILGRKPIKLSFACRSDFDKAQIRQHAIRQKIISKLSSTKLTLDQVITANSMDIDDNMKPTSNVNTNISNGLLTPPQQQKTSSSLSSSLRWTGSTGINFNPTADSYLQATKEPSMSTNQIIANSSFQSILQHQDGTSSGSLCMNSNTGSSIGHPSNQGGIESATSSSIASFLFPSTSSGQYLAPTSTPSSIRTTKAALMEMCSKYQEGTVVSLRGLSYSASESQIIDFFLGFDVIPSSVIITTSEEGKPSGDAFVAFPTHELASRAVSSQSGKYIGPRYVDLSIVN